MYNFSSVLSFITIILFGFSNLAMANEKSEKMTQKTTVFGIEAEAKYTTGYDRSSTNGDIYAKPESIFGPEGLVGFINKLQNVVEISSNELDTGSSKPK